MEIVFEMPGRMNLLGYLLRSRLQARLGDQSFKRRLLKIRKPLQIEAGGMTVFLLAREERLTISVEPFAEPSCAGLRAGLTAILEFVLQRRWLKSFLTGKVRVWGRIWRLTPLLGLLPPRSRT